MNPPKLLFNTHRQHIHTLKRFTPTLTTPTPPHTSSHTYSNADTHTHTHTHTLKCTHTHTHTHTQMHTHTVKPPDSGALGINTPESFVTGVSMATAVRPRR